MKRYIAIYLLAVTVILSTACQTSGVVNGKEYQAYGLLNQDVQKSPDVVYEGSARNIIIGIIFIETVFVPVYVVGWDLYVPVKPAVNKAVERL